MNGIATQWALIGARMQQSYASKSRFFLSYDEAGGLFDHVEPPQLDAY